MGAAVCSPRAPRSFLVVSALAASAPRETSAYSPWTPGTRRTAAGSCETVPRAKKKTGGLGKFGSVYGGGPRSRLQLRLGLQRRLRFWLCLRLRLRLRLCRFCINVRQICTHIFFCVCMCIVHVCICMFLYVHIYLCIHVRPCVMNLRVQCILLLCMFCMKVCIYAYMYQTSSTSINTDQNVITTHQHSSQIIGTSSNMINTNQKSSTSHTSQKNIITNHQGSS